MNIIKSRRGDWGASNALNSFPWPLPNVHLGVSVENQATADERIPLLLQTPAAVRWVSYEPALGAVDFAPFLGCGDRHYDGDIVCPKCGMVREHGTFLDWLVIGGESGPGSRPFDLAWARSAIAQCRAAGVPVFIKQLGSRPIGLRADICDRCNWQTGPGSAHGLDCPRTPVLRDRKGGDWNEWTGPLADLHVREMPR